MSEPFIAEVKIFGGNFAPRGWAFCNGQLLPIAQNTALFSIIGTIYGGDGRTTTGLPNIQGRAVMHPGHGPGLSPRSLGQRSGVSDVTLTPQQMPAHNHTMRAIQAAADTNSPVSAVFADTAPHKTYSTLRDNEVLASQAVSQVGGGGAHNNTQPFTGLNFIIALVGLYPSRS